MTGREYDKKQIAEFGGHQVRNNNTNCAIDGIDGERQLDSSMSQIDGTPLCD